MAYCIWFKKKNLKFFFFCKDQRKMADNSRHYLIQGFRKIACFLVKIIALLASPGSEDQHLVISIDFHRMIELK